METLTQTNNKQKLSLTIECIRTVQNSIEVNLDVNENEKQHIQNLIEYNDWDDVVELLNEDYNIEVRYPLNEWVFDDEVIDFQLEDLYINQNT